VSVVCACVHLGGVCCVVCCADFYLCGQIPYWACLGGVCLSDSCVVMCGEGLLGLFLWSQCESVLCGGFLRLPVVGCVLRLGFGKMFCLWE